MFLYAYLLFVLLVNCANICSCFFPPFLLVMGYFHIRVLSRSFSTPDPAVLLCNVIYCYAALISPFGDALPASALLLLLDEKQSLTLRSSSGFLQWISHTHSQCV